MPNFRHILGAVAGAVALLAFASPAFAAVGVMQQSVNVFAQSGGNGPAVGNIGNGQGVTIFGCAGSWCSISGGGVSGWVAKSAISIKGIIPPPNISPDAPAQPQPNNNGNGNGNNQGNGNNGGGFDFDFNFGGDNGNGNPGPFPPQHQPRPPRPEPVQQSEACFYGRTNFRGESFCVPRGQSYAYLPDGWDNAIRSVEVFGRARVDICRDEDLEGACVTVRSSQSRLPDQLDRRASSIDVY